MRWVGERRQTPDWLVLVGLVVISFVIVFAEAIADLLLGGI